MPLEEKGDAAEDPLDRYHAQDLAWEECESYAVTALDKQYFPLTLTAECARLEVPMDYSEPEGETASVTLADSAITERFDLVGFDPRGVGATEPAVDCYSEDGTTLGDEVFARLGSVAPALTEADTVALFERCADGSSGSDALANVGTRTTANDMDVLREVLGEEKLNFLGQSYGSRLGSVYAEQFPENVRAMILDGAFDPTLRLQDRLVASYSGFQAAFDTLAASCATQLSCPLGTDSAGWTAALQAILQPLALTPVPALTEELDFDPMVAQRPLWRSTASTRRLSPPKTSRGCELTRRSPP